MDNAEGIEYPFDGLSPGQSSSTFSFDTMIVDTVPTGGFSFTGSTGNAVGGTVATLTDPNTSATASAYSASINWGDGTTSPGTITGGNGSFNVAGNHALLGRRHVPRLGHDHVGWHEPGQLDCGRLGRRSPRPHRL